MRALIIDDSRAMRSILSGILDRTGLHRRAGRGCRIGGVTPRADHDFDFALVDWNLPGMNGLELVKIIRKNPELAAIRLMMVTTETQLDRVREALEAGADEYIMKPFDKEMLLEKLTLLGIEA